MSVQLIVYPQYYDGNNPIYALPTEYVVDGINFTNLFSSQNLLSLTGNVPLAAINYLLTYNVPPNTWLKFSANFNYVTEAGGVANFLINTGLLQNLSNLIVGASYDFKIDILTNTAGITFYQYTGNILQSSSVFTGTGQQTFSFTANTSSDIVVLYSAGITFIESMSVTPTPTGLNLSNGQSILDLYEDENIPLTLSVDNFKNVAEKVQSYSKSFKLPATKRNNQIFDNIFEVTRTGSGLVFNPYMKTQCELKQDGLLLFEGFLRLISIDDKEGEISYNVNLYSEVIALADVLKDRKFSDLDFSELAHDYNIDIIRDSWDNNTGLPLLSSLPTSSYAYETALGVNNTNVLKYPFVDWTHQYSQTSSNNPELQNIEDTFRPFINIKYIIERIFEVTPFTFNSSFFDTDDFKKLFMDFNWGGEVNPTSIATSTYLLFWFKTDSSSGSPYPSVLAGTSFTTLELRNYQVINIVVGNVPPNFDTATSVITATNDGETYSISGHFGIENTSATDTIDVECQWVRNTTVVVTQTLTMLPSSTQNFNFTFTETLLNGDTLQAQFKRVDPTSANTIQMRETLPSGVLYSSEVTFDVNTVAMTTNQMLQTLRGETGQWDFLKGLMTMFNLISMTDGENPNQINFEPYADIFVNNPNSEVLDWSDKIDVAEMKLTPLTELNKKTIFKFVEDEDDYAFNVYKGSSGGHLYGSKKYDASGFTILAGEDEIIAEPFAATIVKPLETIYPELIVPTLYSFNSDDGTTEGFENSPRIMYNNGVKTLPHTYSIPAQNGIAAVSEDEFLQFSHLTSVPTIQAGIGITGSRDFHFGECDYMQGVGNTVPSNLFNLYWLPYYSELYNTDTRVMSLKVNLNPSDINSFNFFDTVMMKNREYRVNKIDYKPNDLATVEFILIP
tara:strand:- start:382 stop:3087 length:2706 start_codon:yes stop_codon:yes gene_type:complete